MKLETKRRLGALIAYPLTYVFGVMDGSETQKKELLELRELFKARILGKRLI